MSRPAPSPDTLPPAHLLDIDQPLEPQLARADQALYAAKREGRNRVVASP